MYLLKYILQPRSNLHSRSVVCLNHNFMQNTEDGGLLEDYNIYNISLYLLKLKNYFLNKYKITIELISINLFFQVRRVAYIFWRIFIKSIFKV